MARHPCTPGFTGAEPLADNYVCPLCLGRDTRRLLVDGPRTYWRCGTCNLTFLDPSARPDRETEFGHYLTHENDVHDPRYRSFLGRLAEPLLARLAPARKGLDYGCGPGPALAAMLTEAGHRMAVFDPFFAPDAAALSSTYDFVTCTETAEHFHEPAEEFQRLDGILRPGGILAIMTCFQTDDNRFAGWHYRKDPTHVVFYKQETFDWIAGHFGWSCESPAKDIVFLHKPALT